MNEISPQQLLSQIRAMSRELQPIQQPLPQPDSQTATNFGEMLKTSLNAVSEAQAKSGQMQVDFEKGTGDATLAEVMIASQKASLSFRAATEVRNKLITAYQEIMNMPV